MNQAPTDITFDPTWPLYGHEAAVQFLRRLTQPVRVDDRSHQSDALRQAYLLFGPQQVGKRTLAHMFARAALCTDAEQRPCGRCRACHLVGRANHPDLRIIQPVDKTGVVDRRGGMLRVEQAAEIIHDVALRPMEGRYKVFLIQDMQTANDSFANKLLKTLEEPPSYALFCFDRTGSPRSVADHRQSLPDLGTPTHCYRNHCDGLGSPLANGRRRSRAPRPTGARALGMGRGANATARQDRPAT